MNSNYYRFFLICLTIFCINLCISQEISAIDLAKKEKDIRAISGKKKIKRRALSKALAHYTMGVLYDNERDYKSAIEEYKKALRYDSKNAVLHIRIGMDYLLLDQDAKAIKKLKFAKELDKDNVTSNFLLALIYTTQGKYVFRYYENRSKESVLFESDLLMYLKEHQYPCPAPFLSKQGTSVGIIHGKPYVIFEFID